MLGFESMFDRQVDIQKQMVDKGMYDGIDKFEPVPQDIPQLSSYHIQQLVSEIGEVLEADKRWKNFRNERYDKEAKLDELADCFIVLMNVAMFSGFNASDMYGAIVKKQAVVQSRIGH